MKNIFNKTNAPYLASGALAIGTLLASGIFAVAPYVGFLAPVAALSLGLPFVIGGVVFSAVIMGLSISGILQKRTVDKTISEKDTQLANQAKEIEGKNSQVVLQEEIILKHTKEVNTKEKEISKLEAQLAGKEAVVQAQEQRISEKDAQLAGKDAKISNLEKRLDENEAFYDVVEEQEAEISSLKEQLDEKKNEVEALKTRLAKDAKISDLRERLANGAKVKLSPELRDFLSSPESQLTKPEGKSIPSGAKSGEEKNTENLSPENQPVKEENSQSWGAWSKAMVGAGVGALYTALYYAAPHIPTVLNGVIASQGNDTSVNYTSRC